MCDVRLEDLAEHSDSPVVGFGDDRVIVEISVEVFAQFEVLQAALGTVVDQSLAMGAHVVGRSDSRLKDVSLSGVDDIDHLLVDDLTNGVVASAFGGQLAKIAFHGPSGLGPDANFLEQLFLIEQTAVEAVIQIVAVVGNLIGEVGQLRFQ